MVEGDNTSGGTTPRVVLVTGASRFLGGYLVTRLAQNPSIERVIAVAAQQRGFFDNEITPVTTPSGTGSGMCARNWASYASRRVATSRSVTRPG